MQSKFSEISWKARLAMTSFERCLDVCVWRRLSVSVHHDKQFGYDPTLYYFNLNRLVA